MWPNLKSDVEKERLELQNILMLKRDDQRLTDLKNLALKVGVSTVKLHPGYGDASEPEII